MRQCLNYAVDKGYISSNPFSSVTIDSQRMLRRDTAEVVSHTKTAAGDRFVPLTSEAQKLIDTARQYQKEHHYPDNGYIFSINDKPLTERCISTLYTKYCKKLGIIQKSSHKARKTFVSTLAHDYKIAVNDKRVLRICRKKKIQSYIKHRYNCCTKPASDPAYVAENILNREFKSDMINQKWVTDISEFKYGVGEDNKKGKLYLSVILDLCDRRPVAFVYSTRNDNPLVFDTFDKAVAANPGATPLLHSDRGYQYTSKAFRRRILAAGMTQSIFYMIICISN